MSPDDPSSTPAEAPAQALAEAPAQALAEAPAHALTNPERRIFRRDNVPALLAALFSGLVLKLVSPPVGFDFLHWATFVPLFVVVADVPRRQAFKLGYLSGFAGVFVLFFWLAQTIDLFSNIPLVLASLIVALFAAVWGLPYGVLSMAIGPFRRRFGAFWPFPFACLWVGVEFAQPALFPYFQGVGQYRNPYTWQLASVFGAMGVSWLLILTNATLAAVVLARREKTTFPTTTLAITAALFLANLGFGAWRFNQVETTLAAGPVAKVAMLQQGVTMVQRIQDRGSEVLVSWLELTTKAITTDGHLEVNPDAAKDEPQIEIVGTPVADLPDLVVWPEGSIYYNPTDKRVLPIFEAMTRQYGFSFLVGGGTREADPENPGKRASWNSAYLFGPDGKVNGRYDKMVPMPFGEYLPWPFSYLKPYIEGVGSFRPGTKPTVFETDQFSFTTPICYEAILERQMRTLADGDAYVNITNDGWFGDTAAPHQHAMLSAVAAVEMGRPMLRIAYTGVSMIVEPHGVIRYETQPYKESVQVVDLRLAQFATPYRSWGRYFPWVASLVAIGALIALRRPVTLPPSLS